MINQFNFKDCNNIQINVNNAPQASEVQTNKISFVVEVLSLIGLLGVKVIEVGVCNILYPTLKFIVIKALVPGVRYTALKVLLPAGQFTVNRVIYPSLTLANHKVQQVLKGKPSVKLLK